MSSRFRRLEHHLTARLPVRTIQFTPNDLRFDICYSALYQSPLPLRGSTERKTQIAIADKLEVIGQIILVRDQQTGEMREHRKNELVLYETVVGGSVVLTEPEYDFVKRHVAALIDSEVFPKAWTRQGESLTGLLDATLPMTDTNAV